MKLEYLCAKMEDSYRHKGLRRQLMLTLERKGIEDRDVLEAINKVPRHLFMDLGFTEFAYKDQAFPIGEGQTISQPYTVAFQTQLLGLAAGDKVLEIGTGSGYQAAVLLEMNTKVYTIERHRPLYLRTQKLMRQLNYHAHFFYGDGYIGKQAYAPFDKILITAAAPYISDDLKAQLRIGGVIVAPMGEGDSQEMITLVKISETEFEQTNFGRFAFVPMLKGTQ